MIPMDARVVMLGDSAWLVVWPPGAKLDARLAEVHAVMRVLEDAPGRPHGVLGVAGAFESLAVRYDAYEADAEAVREWLVQALGRADVTGGFHGTEHEIPVCYGDGGDLFHVAREVGLTEDEVVTRHSAAGYTVAMVGFSPGFPYLSGLPEELRVRRLATPRNRVEAGAVAIAGEQAGIYPCASPGGWRVLGRTGVCLFDPARTGGESLLAAGDRVRFLPVRTLKVTEPERVEVASRADIEVLEPGFFTTVQDAGRPDFEHIGVSPGGAMDVEALRVANILLGNAMDAAALEVTVNGPVLKFAVDSRVVLVGADAAGGLRHGRAVTVAAGNVLVVGPLTGAMRAVLAVAGGIDVPRVMGSRSTDVRAGFGGPAGRPLIAGDALRLGEVAPENAPAAVQGVGLANPVGREVVIRTLDGPQVYWFCDETVERFYCESYEMTTRQDRMGVRLHGVRMESTGDRQMRSQPVATGSIQLPPDGRPMVLMAERQTHGGYPQIGCVITPDVPLLARALPGTRIRFRRVEPEEARSATRKAARDLQWLRAGLSCRE